MSDQGAGGASGSIRERLGDHFGPAVVAGLIAIGLLAAAVIAITGPIRGPALVSTGATGGATPTTTSGGAGTGSTAPTPTVPALPAFDGFDRADGPLGSTKTGAAWSQTGGTFTVKGGQACTSGPTGATPALAVVDTTSGNDIGVSAKMTKIAEDVGIVFHYKDAGNYLALVAVPKLAAWRFVVVRDGKVKSQSPLPLTPAVDGTVISVIFSAGKAAVAADGKLSKVVDVSPADDPAGLKVGLIDRKAATAACWDDLAVRTPG